ncbi:NADPH-dependent 2,4-dienoyl-CoA reductase/sulfur reductase-like enzyme/rhodanese-related sulfurtransferase [Desulfobaculum xiamenense]|uniref:NADPH-dependent 2,4-dienoyl-CoA reductase/sulfur reductase-like enzyme/rhodanese-related sulfurtransferase n=1 Tax=Desulfobaculum xiamenense TaxID=995050 RepID=A0A846QFQ7_9BACT|nr:FAD-dependent oxidoreductase [Desulfobaculum xiamenense]NJB67626.1 NADPH-dependent 2,4-dienoyl-CoA reductase/sulfur reductase-like enzyme/rhodanese-related sulfurtransferase [Desulfobaculum xiamenense]
MGRRIVIIGAVALGPKAACRARRLDPEAEITLIDRDTIISYGGCGIPYYVSGDIANVDELFSTVFHAVRDPEFFDVYKRVNVRTATEALSIDRKAKSVRVRDLKTGEESDIAYDTLVLATGSTPFVPPVEGVDLPGVVSISNLHKAIMLKDQIAAGKIGSAVVVGGGAIGLEMAEALTALWGVETTLVEMCDHVLPQAIGPDLAGLLTRHLEDNGVSVMASTRVQRIVGDEDGVTAVETDKGTIPCDLVIFGAGARPNTAIAREAGLAVGPFGGLLVDARMRTSDPNIYAGGDCVEVRNLITGGSMYLPLGSLANRQGRVIGTNIAGGNERFDGAVGTFCLKAFDMAVATAGLTLAQAKAAGFDAVEGLAVQADRAHFYPGHKWMFLKLVADRKTRRVLGVEAVGEAGDAVKARVDAVAALLGHHPDLDDVSNLEVGYAPPFASAMDIVNAAGNALKNVLDGFSHPVEPSVFLRDILPDESKIILDVRSAKQGEPMTRKYGKRWINIPQDELPRRYDELPRDVTLHVICNTGLRSYESQVLLRAKGFTDLVNVHGGYLFARMLDPTIVPDEA